MTFFTSTKNRISFFLRKKLHFSRPNYKEVPCKNLTNIEPEQQTRISELKKKYKINFESQFQQVVCLDNYHYLDLLDRFFDNETFGSKSALDVGSKNFYYAVVLHRFFKLKSLLGIEVDGFKIYADLHSRYDYAMHYKSFASNTDYVVCDFTKSNLKPVDLITLFYPFVTPSPLLKWTLPLNLLQPEKLFQKTKETLNENGQLLMINPQGEESDIAFHHAKNVGLKLLKNFAFEDTLIETNPKPIMSLWQKEKP